MVSFLLKPRCPLYFCQAHGRCVAMRVQKKCKLAGIFLGVIGVPPTNFTLKSIICECADASQECDGPAFHMLASTRVSKKVANTYRELDRIRLSTPQALVHCFHQRTTIQTERWAPTTVLYWDNLCLTQFTSTLKHVDVSVGIDLEYTWDIDIPQYNIPPRIA